MSLYNSKSWFRLRHHQLQSQPLCVMCDALGKLTPATVVDHITPHKGDLQLFSDPANLQSVCKPCHDKAKQIQETKGHLIGGKPDGMPIDPNHHWNRARR